MNFCIMGGEKGCMSKTQEQITEGTGKKRKAAGAAPSKTTASQQRKDEGRRKAGDATKTVHLARGQQDDCHSHVCILPQCAVFYTPNKRIRGGCVDSAKATHQCQVTKTRTFGLEAQMCRNCHKDATHCMTPVWTSITCSRPQKFCKHLHTNLFQNRCRIQASFE